jgi:hypothetical protein
MEIHGFALPVSMNCVHDRRKSDARFAEKESCLSLIDQISSSLTTTGMETP